MSLLRRVLLMTVISVICVGCDQATKSLARSLLPEMQVYSFFGDTFRLQLAYNRGAFLSLGSTLPEHVRQWLLVVGVGLVLAAILFYALFSRSARSGVVLGIALVFAGGVSNLADRIVLEGFVVDFMNLGIGTLRTGIFNVADIAIMAGFFVLLFSGFADLKKAPG